MGSCKDPCKLSGSAFDEDDMLHVLEKANDFAAIGTLYFYKTLLNYLFGNYRQSLENSKMAERYSDATAAVCTVGLSWK